MPSFRGPEPADVKAVFVSIRAADVDRVARSQADLEFTRVGIDPEFRDAVPGMRVSGGVPDRWKKLLPDELKFAEYPVSTQ